MSLIGLAVPDADIALLALVAAAVATCGRIVLASLSHTIVRGKLLSEQVKQNVDTIRRVIEKRPTKTFGAFLGYALSPLPSNYLFIAYGLTSVTLTFLVVPFLVGRLVNFPRQRGTVKISFNWVA